MSVNQYLQTKCSIKAVVACSDPKNLPFDTDSILNHLRCIHCGIATSAVTPRNSSDVMMSGLFAMCECCNPINEWIVCICCLQKSSQHHSYKKHRKNPINTFVNTHLKSDVHVFRSKSLDPFNSCSIDSDGTDIMDFGNGADQILPPDDMFTFQKAVDINKVLFDANILTANNEDA
jgi:hypothetical protein